MLIKTVTSDNKILLIETINICFIEKTPDETSIISMNNGQQIEIKEPKYLEWESDVLINKI